MQWAVRPCFFKPQVFKFSVVSSVEDFIGPDLDTGIDLRLQNGRKSNLFGVKNYCEYIVIHLF
jgi:hypothetical protein